MNFLLQRFHCCCQRAEVCAQIFAELAPKRESPRDGQRSEGHRRSPRQLAMQQRQSEPLALDAFQCDQPSHPRARAAPPQAAP